MKNLLSQQFSFEDVTNFLQLVLLEITHRKFNGILTNIQRVRVKLLINFRVRVKLLINFRLEVYNESEFNMISKPRY